MSGHIDHCGLIPPDGMVVLPCMFSYCRCLKCPFPAGLLVLPQPVLQPSSGLTDVALAATLVEGPSPGSALSAVTVQT